MVDSLYGRLQAGDAVYGESRDSQPQGRRNTPSTVLLGTANHEAATLS